MTTSEVPERNHAPATVNRSAQMDGSKNPDRKSAVALRDPADTVPVDTAQDGWLDRALEDSFPASDPIARHVFS
jgi:hypothetical protein